MKFRSTTSSKRSLVAAIMLAVIATMSQPVAAVSVPDDTPLRAAVKRSVQISAPAAATVGRPFAVVGKVSKTPKGKVVKLQLKNGSSWQILKRTKTKRRGAYSFKVTSYSPATATYRVVAGKTKVGGVRLAASSSRAVTVRIDAPPVTYVDYAWEDWTPFGGSGSPAFSRESYVASHWLEADVPVGQTAWVSFDLKGQCRSGTITLSNDGYNTVAHFTIKVDGAAVSAQEVGFEATRLVELSSLAGAGQLEVSASVTATNKYGTTGEPRFWGTASCVSGTSS